MLLGCSPGLLCAIASALPHRPMSLACRSSLTAHTMDYRSQIQSVQVQCRDYSRGRCRRGNRCPFWHGSQPPQQPPAGVTPRAAQFSGNARAGPPSDFAFRGPRPELRPETTALPFATPLPATNAPQPEYQPYGRPSNHFRYDPVPLSTAQAQARFQRDNPYHGTKAASTSDGKLNAETEAQERAQQDAQNNLQPSMAGLTGQEQPGPGGPHTYAPHPNYFSGLPRPPREPQSFRLPEEARPPLRAEAQEFVPPSMASRPASNNDTAAEPKPDAPTKRLSRGGEAKQ